MIKISLTLLFYISLEKLMQKKLSANNTIFKINVDFENSKADYINSKESTQGVNNTLVLIFS